MSNLSVCCVMLANGRPLMVERAIRSFKAQTLPSLQRFLLIYDNGDEPLYPRWQPMGMGSDIGYAVHPAGGGKLSIGKLRNIANELAFSCWDCIAHWDSDDWSHPSRLMEQLTFLELTKHVVTGYKDLVFFDELTAQAWLWRELDNRKPLGGSLCYRRSAWERAKFLDAPNASGATSEYYHWLKLHDSHATSSLPKFHGECAPQRPRMIGAIHGGNTSYYDPAAYVAAQSGTSWKRAEEWDTFCRETMKL